MENFADVENLSNEELSTEYWDRKNATYGNKWKKSSLRKLYATIQILLN